MTGSRERHRWRLQTFLPAFGFCFLAGTHGFHLNLAMSSRFRRPVTSLHQEHASSSATESKLAEQIFHHYDKPIVLLGVSGAGRELSRLAASLQERLGPNTPSDSADTAPAIVSIGAETDEETLMQQIENRFIQWPQIILLDSSHPSIKDVEAEEHYATIARRLYDDKLLSIYVNVDTHASNMPEMDAGRKQRLEDDVFVKYSDYEICIRDEGLGESGHWEHIEWEFQRLLARARLAPAIPGDTVTRSVNSAHLTMGQHTFFLSLSFPSITQVEPFVEEMCQDVDAMEYRADLLECRDNRFDLLYGMQLLRRYCRPHCVRVPALPCGGRVLEDVMPIVYTVRTRHQAGTYPDDEAGIAKMFEMLHWGLRAGVEVLDVESAWEKDKIDTLLYCSKERYSSQILGSEHVVGRTITTADAVGLFQQCAMDGRAHGAKVVLSIDREDQDRMAHEAALIASSLAKANKEPDIPKISLILGDIGKFSRVINLPFTPVTHQSLPMKAAPGQMTSSEIMATRLFTKIFTPKKYCILGHNIAYSVSPQMQGAAFAATQLPHEYIRADTASVDEFVASNLFRSDDFGGASVTIPHKQAIIPFVDVLSDAAQEIGSVNTLIVREEYVESDGFKRVLYGDNTDWKGFFNPLKRLLGSVKNDSDYALIVGAGGTARAAAYVATKLGLQCLFYNRTPAKASDLVASFGGTVLYSLQDRDSHEDSLGNILSRTGGSLRVVISTLPAAAGFILPDWLIEKRRELPIVFDVNYKPFNTELLLQAEGAGCKIVRGSEMLWEQGVGQFELWTERTAPYRVMKQVVLSNCQ